MLAELVSFFEKNYSWIFSGIGVLVISLLFFKEKFKTKQTMKNSTGIISGGDTKISISHGQNENVRQEND